MLPYHTKVALPFESVGEMIKCDHSNESYTEQYFPVMLFIMLYMVNVTLQSKADILKCNRSHESSRVQECFAIFLILKTEF